MHYNRPLLESHYHKILDNIASYPLRIHGNKMLNMSMCRRRSMKEKFEGKNRYPLVDNLCGIRRHDMDSYIFCPSAIES